MIKTTHATEKRWSESLRKVTRKIIEAGDVIAPNGRLHLKNGSGVFGYITQDDMMRGVLNVAEVPPGSTHIFITVDDLLKNGWVVD